MKRHQHDLAIFYQKIRADERILPSHASLFLALYWQWMGSNFANSIHVYRKELMVMARINSVVTYHKCIRELHAYGYIVYKPTYDYYKGSEVFITL
jgi:hypothetical protein